MNPFPVNPDLLEHLVDGVLVVDEEGIVQFANRAAHEMFSGFDAPLVGFHFGVSVSPEGKASVVQLPGDRKPRQIELRTNQIQQDGRFTYIISLRDVTNEWELNERNRELSRIVESSEDAIISMDLDGTITSWNPGAANMYGYTPEEAMDQNIRMLIPPDLKDDANRILEQTKRGNTIVKNQTIRQTRDGTRLNVSLSVSPVRDEKGIIIGAAKIARNVTGEVIARAHIEHLNRVLRAIREVNRLIVHQRDSAKLIQSTCDILVETRGFVAASILLTDKENEIKNLSHAGLDKQSADAFSEKWSCGKLPKCCQELLSRKDTSCGKSFNRETCPLAGFNDAHNSYIVCLRNQGISYGFLCVSSTTEFIDGSEDTALVDEVAGDIGMALQNIQVLEKQEYSLALLRHQEELLNDTGQMAQVGGWELDLDNDIVEWTQTTKRIHEVEDDHRRTLKETLKFFPDCYDKIAEAIRKARKHGTPYDLELPFVTARKNRRWIRTMGTPEMENGVCTRLHGVIQDITEHKQAERKKLEALEVARRESDLVKLIIDHGLMGFTMVNREGKITEANAMAETILGLKRDKIVNTHYKAPEWKITGENGEPFPEEQLPVNRVFETGKPVRNVEHSIEWPTGEKRTLNVCAGPLFDAEGKLESVACTVEDITDRKEMEAQLLQSQKMESIGQLAGGVAHDFNNLLMGVMGYAELCLELLEDNHPARKWMSEIINETDRSANLTRQLLAFARKQDVKPQVLELNAEVEGMMKMLRRLIGENIELKWHPGPGELHLKMDPGQIDQILANLCVNARDAIGGVGTVSISTKKMKIEAARPMEDGYLKAGSYILLEVKDTGQGMNAQTRDHIFEPFFTTKEVGKGTGLGLATVYGIIKQNKGGIEVRSRENEGTAFQIFLPCHKGEMENKKQEKPSRTSSKGSEKILIVEDEPSIRDTLSLCLSHMGYEVVKAEDPEHALALSKEEIKEIDLVITDVIMPGMNGRELTEKLRQELPGLKVLYISGYTADIIAERGLVEPGFEFLSKPITSKALAEKVREMLDA